MYESIALLLVALVSVALAPSIVIPDKQNTRTLQGVVSRTIPSEEVQASIEPFMTLPLRESDVPAEGFTVNEGWYYSPEEMAIHGKPLHRGIDWPIARGTPVVAVADGYAVRSFQLATTNKAYQGKSVGFSLGEFVEIWHPEQGVYTLYGHLNRASDDVPYVTSQRLAPNIWEPTGIYVGTDTFMERATPVKRGQVIGYAGDSGVGWGYSDTFNTQTRHVAERDYAALPSWDETHLHLEVYTRTANGRFKAIRFDPFDLYDYVRSERNPYTDVPSAHTLWLTDEDGQPEHPENL